jgi:hypothetical protein
MARNDATTDPKDESIIAATTEPSDSGDALLDPSYSNEINTDRESSEPGELTSDRGDDDPSAGSANEGGDEIDMERLGGGVIDSPDDLGGDTSGSTLLDDLGASSETEDPADGFDGMTSDGGGISNIDLQNISPSDLPSGQGGGLEPTVGQGGSDKESQGGDDGESQGVTYTETMPAPDDGTGGGEIQGGGDRESQGGDDGESQGGTTPQGGQTMPAPDDGTGGGEIQGGGDSNSSDGGGISNIDLQNSSASDLPSGLGGGSERTVGQDGDGQGGGGSDGQGGEDGQGGDGGQGGGGQRTLAPDDGTGGDPNPESDIIDVNSDLTRDSASPTLLDGDGDLAEMAAAAEQSDTEIEIDSFLPDVDIGDDV